MAINNIKEYLIERLLDLDPSLSSREGSLMFVKVIDPLIKRLGTDPIAINIESFLVQRLRDEFPELDVDSPGSSIRDVLVSPLVLLMEPIRREVEFLRTQQSLANARALTNEELDALLTNVFSQRSLGDFARGIVRVFFSAPYAAGIDPTITFTSRGGQSFIPDDVYVANISDFGRSGRQYFLDIVVRSTIASSDHNVKAGEVNRVSGLRNVVRVSNLTGFSGGTPSETNEEFLERAERSLSERSLNTKRGIETNILNNFSDILSVDVVGFGEDEMQRDILQGEVSFDQTESTGPMSYMTSDWKAFDIFNSTSKKRFPFTNTIILKEPTSGWTAKSEERITGAKYLRIADGASDNFDNRLLGRVRSIDQVYKHASGDYYIRTKDFEAYPKQPNIYSQVTPGIATTLDRLQGLNHKSAQGSNYQLYTTDDGKDLVIGGHLPFTDIVETTFLSTEVPGSVIKGRDFLITASEETHDRDGSAGADPTYIEFPVKLRAYPLTRFFSSRELGIGRVDSFLMSRGRYLYKGVDEFVFDSSLTYCAINETPKIIDFGAPKYSEYPSQSKAYGGDTTETGGRSAGATLVGALVDKYGPGSTPSEDIYSAGAIQHEVDLVLNNSQPSWAERGVSIGDHVACAVYGIGESYDFDGDIDNIEGNIAWYGVGKVKKVGYDNKWKLRLQGLDWSRLEQLQIGGFAPSAMATVKVLEVGAPSAPSNGSGSTLYSYTGNKTFAPHPSESLNYRLDFDTDGDGLVDKSLHASALDRWWNQSTGAYEPASSIDTRSIIVISLDAADFTGLPDDIKLVVKDGSGATVCETTEVSKAAVADIPDLVAMVTSAVNGSKIVDDDPSTGNNFLLEPNDDSLIGNVSSNGFEGAAYVGGEKIVLRNMCYGNNANQRGWYLEITDPAGHTLDIDGIDIGTFSVVNERTPAALAGQLAKQCNYYTGGSFQYTAYVDPEEPETVRFSSTKPSTNGNGEGVTDVTGTSHFDIPEWDGYVLDGTPGVGNINGGFSGGFGPMLQVVGIVEDAKLSGLIHFNDLANQGYETLSLTPLSGDTEGYVANTANGNLVRKRHSSDSSLVTRIILELTTDAGDEIRYVLEADVIASTLDEGQLAANEDLSVVAGDFTLDTFRGTIDFTSGLVSLEVAEDVDIPNNLTAFAAYSYYYSPYRVAWTVYRGSIEVLDASGRPSKSFDELSFAPALKNSFEDSALHTGTAGFNTTEFYSTGTYFERVSSIAALGSDDNDFRAVWIRLGKGFNVSHPSIGASPSEYIRGLEVSQVVGRHPHNDIANVHNKAYLTARYGDGEIHSKTSLPVSAGSEGQGFGYDSDGNIVLDTEQQPLPNLKGLSGFLIPTPMGTYSYDEAAYSATGFDSNDVLEHQVVQLFEGASDDFGDTKILVSGIPGSVPLPGITSTDLEISSDSIHIGGMTDVYVKTDRTENRTTEEIRLTPESIEYGSEDADVLLQANDGSVTPAVNPSHFFSAELEAELTNLYGPAPAYVGNLVLEIIEPPSIELQPVFVRVIHSIPGGVKIDGSFPESLGSGFENLRFRVMRKVTTSLNQPLEVLQQGDDLSIVDNDFIAYFAGGIGFTTDPETIGMYLSIDSDTGRGEYSVVSRNLDTLELDRVPTESGSGLSYRIYTKQATRVNLPLVRVNEASLSQDAVGIKIPYAKPVDIVGSSFAGLNDDPITEDFGSWDGGTLSIETVTINGEAQERCVFTVEGAQFKDYGVIRYDVLVLSELDAPLKHWYIDDIVLYDSDGDGTSEYSRLILDRAESLTEDSVMTPFTIGKPSIGTASVKFLDRTFFEAGPDCQFCYRDPVTDKKHYLRPSPAETSVIFKNVENRTDVELLESNPKDLVSTTDFFKYGVLSGDRIRLVTKVLRTNEFNGSETALEHENLMVAGKTLAFKIDNSLKTVTFSGPNPLTLTTVMNDINRQLGGLLRADIGTENRDDDGDGVDEPYYRLMIYSNSDVEIVTQGTIGIIDDLRFSESNVDNTPVGDLIGEFLVESVSYVDATSSSDGQQRTIITLDEPISHSFDVSGKELLFIEVVRDGHQRVYPNDLVQEESGLYSAAIKLTSYEPNTENGVVPEDAQLEATGYDSLGYCFVVENRNYSYSVGEQVSFSCSSIILSDTAADFEDAYEVAGAGVTINYDTAPTVDSIQSYMLSPNSRVLCNNPLVRHYFPAYPFMTITYTGEMSEDTVRDSISSLLSGLYPNLPLEIYTLTASLARLGVKYLSSPQEAGFVVYDADRNISVVRSQDIVALTKQAHIMEDMSLVTINKVG
tara:strand:+ start:7676 stop:14506 length:6831 start_codon:yes stop_codon:yes gene_type:complete